MPAPRPEIPDLLEVAVPPGGKVITASDLHLPPVRSDVSGRSCETLARHLAEEPGGAGPGGGNPPPNPPPPWGEKSTPPPLGPAHGRARRRRGRTARFPRGDGDGHPARARRPVRGAAGGDRARRTGYLRDRQPRRRPSLGCQDRG